jgi:hypothetical protein
MGHMLNELGTFVTGTIAASIPWSTCSCSAPACRFSPLTAARSCHDWGRSWLSHHGCTPICLTNRYISYGPTLADASDSHLLEARAVEAVDIVYPPTGFAPGRRISRRTTATRTGLTAARPCPGRRTPYAGSS